MSAWIRWSYVLPRLALAGLMVGLVAWGLDGLVRQALIAAGQRMVGAKVEIGSVHTRLLWPEVRLRHVSVANPHHPMENLFEADQVVLALDGDSLLRRKYVVRQGEVHGLRLRTERATSGALERPARSGEAEPGGLGDGLDRLVRDAVRAQIRQLGRLIRTRAEDQIEQLHTVRAWREIVQRWPAEFQRLEARLQALRQQGRSLHDLFQGHLDPKQLARHPKRLLDDPQALARATAQAEDLYCQLAELRSELGRLEAQLQADRQALQRAYEEDRQTIARLMPSGGLDPQGLSEYLLGPDLSRRVSTLLQWVHWARQHWPHSRQFSPPERLRGVDVMFAGIRRRPDWVLQQLAIDGQGRWDDQVFQFRGTARDLCSHPAWYGKPATVRIEVAGKSAVEIEARLDRTGATPHDHVVVRCPALEQPPRMLGDPEGLALVVSPGHTRLDLVLDLAERELRGRLVLRQEPVQLVPRADDLAAELWWPELELALGQIRSLEATVELFGPVDRPRWRVASDLGPQVAQAANHTLGRLYERYRQELLALADRRLHEILTDFDAHLVRQQQELAQQLELASAELQDLRQLVAHRLPQLREMFRDQLPARLPLRF